MKTLLYFTLVGLLLGVGACKKEQVKNTFLIEITDSLKGNYLVSGIRKVIGPYDTTYTVAFDTLFVTKASEETLLMHYQGYECTLNFLSLNNQVYTFAFIESEHQQSYLHHDSLYFFENYPDSIRASINALGIHSQSATIVCGTKIH